MKRTVWITGASTGIGYALAQRFAAGGDTVIATSRSEEKLQQLKIKEPSVITEVCDLRNEDAVATKKKKIVNQFSTVDILINNAGVTYFKEFAETTIEEFDHVIDTNLKGTFLTTKAVLPAMLENQHGLIINILSFTVKSVYTKSSVYAASKAGVDAMMNVLRAEVRKNGIKVVNVYPGAVLTPIWHPKQQEKYGSQMLHPDTVANMIYTLSQQPEELLVEEIILRPQGGDLQV